MTTQDEGQTDIVQALNEINTSLAGLKGESKAASWQKLGMLVVVVAALAWAIIYIVGKYDTASDAASILGIVVPVFATIGAAVFGVQVAYERGAKKAEESAADEVNTAQEDAATARSEAAAAHDDATQIAIAARRVVDVAQVQAEGVDFSVQASRAGDDPITELRTLADRILN